MVEGTGEVFLTQIEAEAFATRGAKNRESGYGKNHGKSYGLLGGAIAHVALRTTALGSVFGVTEGGSAVVVVEPFAEATGVVVVAGSGEATVVPNAEAEAQYIIETEVEAVITLTAEADGEAEEASVTGSGAVEIAVTAAGSGELEIIVATPRPAYRDPWVSIGHFRLEPEIAPVTGEGQASIRLSAVAVGTVGSTGVGSAGISLQAHAEGECGPGHFEDDNAFFMLAA